LVNRCNLKKYWQVLTVFVLFVISNLLAYSIVFSDRLGRLTVIFGVVGAGIAFALQEVIGSFAGWVAISLGQFYKPARRSSTIDLRDKRFPPACSL
jgi:small-conductance mechanosensitive channel